MSKKHKRRAARQAAMLVSTRASGSLRGRDAELDEKAELELDADEFADVFAEGDDGAGYGDEREMTAVLPAVGALDTMPAADVAAEAEMVVAVAAEAGEMPPVVAALAGAASAAEPAEVAPAAATPGVWAAPVGPTHERAGAVREGPYAALFQPVDDAERQGYRRVVRAGTGLVIVTTLHGALRKAERRAIARFRKEHGTAADSGGGDGQMGPRDVHVCVGDRAGDFLCYLALRSPDAGTGSAWRAIAPRLADCERALFPCEAACGPEALGAHPALGLLPVASVRELVGPVRAGQYGRGGADTDGHPRERLALEEAVVAVLRLLCDPRTPIEAVVGRAAHELRHLLHGLGAPLAFAPDLAGEPGGHRLFAVATRDLAGEAVAIWALDAALDGPEHEALRAVAHARARGPRRASRLVAEPGACGGGRWALLPRDGALAQMLALAPGWRCAPADGDGVAALCARTG